MMSLSRWMKMFDVNYCRCGCSITISPRKTYVSGHNMRGVKHTKEHTDKIVIGMRETLKKRYSNGEIVVWNKGLTKNSDERIKKYGERTSETRHRKISTGEIICKSWNKGKIMSESHRKGISLGILARKIKRTQDEKRRLREKMIRHIEQHRGKFRTNIGEHERELLDKMEKAMCIEIKRQYKVIGYFLDGYNERLNVAFEVDEEHHRDDRDKERQQEIEKVLGCKFIRIKDTNEEVVKNDEKYNKGSQGTLGRGR